MRIIRYAVVVFIVHERDQDISAADKPINRVRKDSRRIENEPVWRGWRDRVRGEVAR